ncbi:MAG: class I SAM-dependent methyltransferase [Bdellovibrionales bacterium]|nr:class I SAM-dependent methyltransferase [Bdellovibrionales bacterium]
MESGFSGEGVALYDEIYTRMKNYREEAEKVQTWIQKFKPDAKTLLDVACGTAEHARFLKAQYKIDGLDISKNFVEAAIKKNPECRYFHGDMIDFKLDDRYDVIICLFSSIGYVVTEARLRQTIRNFASHLNPGGILLVEPWFSPDRWKPGAPFMVNVNEPLLKVARMNITTTTDDGASYMKMHYLVGTPKGVQHFTEEHTLGLFTVDQMKSAFEAAGLQVQFDEAGIFGRGLYIAQTDLQNDS